MPRRLKTSYGKVSIAMNNKLTGGTNNNNKKTVSILKATASETLLLIDSYKWWIQTESSQMSASKLINAQPDWRIARHNNFASITYLDGHVVSKSYTVLLSKNLATDTFWDPNL